MSDYTDRIAAYEQARAAFDARWEKAMGASDTSEVKVVDTLTLDGMLDRALVQVRELALTCAEGNLIDAAGRDAILAATDQIKQGFAGIPPKDLVEVMRSIRVQPPPQPPKYPPSD